MSEDLKSLCDRLRGELLVIEKTVREVKSMFLSGNSLTASPVFDAGECIAQSMLAVRHIEDARMRLGKVIQHARDGVSVFDKPNLNMSGPHYPENSQVTSK